MLSRKELNQLTGCLGAYMQVLTENSIERDTLFYYDQILTRYKQSRKPRDRRYLNILLDNKAFSLELIRKWLNRNRLRMNTKQALNYGFTGEKQGEKRLVLAV